MGRIVSLQDYEDFAAGFAGIGKAQAVELVRGETSFVHVTVAAADGSGVAPASELYLALVKEIGEAPDPDPPLQVDSFQPIFFHVTASIRIDRAVTTRRGHRGRPGRVRTAFSFPVRAFGKLVTAAEVVTTIQDVAGVEAVDLDFLFRVDDASNPPPASLASIFGRSRAAGARWRVAGTSCSSSTRSAS